MMKRKGHVIEKIDDDSIAWELELEPGDRVLTINGNEIEDIFDYEYYINSEEILMEVEKQDGEIWELEIEHNYEDLGITFENGLMSEYRSCRNKCVFCFIDQMPPGMRDTLYFKDDDTRLSFLQGNYVTLTNLSEKDVERIIKFKLSPINISVHTTNPELRCKMLHNRFAGDALKIIDQLFAAQTPMNGQIVLCKGLNDGEELERTIRELSGYLPYMESLSVVPVGLSQYREGLYPLASFTKEDAVQTIDIIERWQNENFKKHGTHFVHASDEFYIMAERELPEESRYDGYIQLENGVGMLRLMSAEVQQCMMSLKGDDNSEEISVATGELAYEFLKEFIVQIQKKYPNRIVHLYKIKNEFFGEQITVTGLITGQDLIKQLTGKRLGSRLLLSSNMFRSGEEVFLDDITRQELENTLQVSVNIVKSSGQDFVLKVLNESQELEESPVKYQGYELKEINYE